ncbi:MAG: 4Fe-4S dicluster domain-containing protein [Bacilli bacterium]|nr:4Fe-4S dicluster domain-containing protein [Bacilli bacterium]
MNEPTPKFDTRVQELKYKVLKEVAKSMWNDSLQEDLYDIPKTIVPGPKPSMRCCIYKERAIVEERIKVATNNASLSKNIVQVIKIACDECPIGGYQVTNVCRGCIAHRCEKACRKNAIKFDPKTRTASIDKEICVNCGLCAKACSYNAIQNFLRPCQQACKIKALTIDENFAADIDESKCINCGHCVAQCPFGAIMDKSFIGDVINMIKDSDYSKKYKVYAIVAPSISSQFKYATLGQVITAIKRLGFHSVIEAALGADMVAFDEAKELEERGQLTSSCCPAFVQLIKKTYPKIADKISHNPSPMVAAAKYIKSIDPTAKTVFIGPCIAKKSEGLDENVKPFIDSVMTFEELQALIDSRNIVASELEENKLDNASYYGRIFARCGGLSESVAEALKEQGSSFEVKGLQADGIDNCKLALNKFNVGDKTYNFIEGMACTGGCIGGPSCLTHEIRDKNEVDKYGREAAEKTILDAIRIKI